MVSKPLISLLMSLVIVTQLVRTHGLSTVSPHSDEPAEHSHTTMAKKNESSYLYLIGGRTKDNAFSNSTSRLATATGEWKTMRSMPTARNWFCGAVVEKKIYLFGGLKLEESPIQEMASDDVYDCLTDTYTPLPLMPDNQLKDCAAAVLGPYIYVSGGEQPTFPRGKRNVNAFKILKRLLRFDTRTNQWTTLSEMNQYRSQHQLIELDGLLYAIASGLDGTEVYNPTTNKWSKLAEKHSVAERRSGASHEGKIYSLGSAGFQVYSPDTFEWKNLTLPQFDVSYEWFSSIKLVSMNGKLWAVGGRAHSVHKDKKLLESFHSYDPSTDQWTKEQKIDVERDDGFSAFVVNL